MTKEFSAYELSGVTVLAVNLYNEEHEDCGKQIYVFNSRSASIGAVSYTHLVGVRVGVILSKVISMLNGTPTAISPAAAILAVLFSMAITKIQIGNNE